MTPDEKRDSTMILVSLPSSVASTLEELAEHRKTTPGELLQRIVSRYMKEHVPKPGDFRPDITDPEGVIVRLANALLADAIDSGSGVIEIPKSDGSRLTGQSADGNLTTVPEHIEPYLRLRFEHMASMETGTIPLLHAGRRYTAHVTFSGPGKDQKMRLWIEQESPTEEKEL